MPLLTVAICTYNRAALLRRTLERLTELAIPEGYDWELVVVNNASTDDTAAVLADLERRLPLRSLVVSEPGVANARNGAAGAARGDYILWTDDDVLVAPDWMAAYVAAFRRWPEAELFGGPVEPWFEGEPPSWLREGFAEVAGAFAAVDYGAESRPLTVRDYPYGANMAVRATALRRVRFDPTLGRRGKSLLGGEETRFCQDLLNGGATGRWVPEARVRHFLPQARQTVGFLRRFYVAYGEYLVKMEGVPPGRMLLGRPLWLWRQALVSEARYQWLRRTAPAPQWLRALRQASTTRGRLRWARAATPSAAR